MADPGEQEWAASTYDEDHAYVADYGGAVVDLLDPEPGERILDIGCGTGHLTAEIATRVGEAGNVVGIDQSEAMLAEAREAHPSVRFVQADATQNLPAGPYDAVFSNAALHWIEDQDAVTAAVAEALVPDGRFVVEMGGTGNIATIIEAVEAELEERGYEMAVPWYFPTIGEHAAVLERHDFELRKAWLFDRPTELDGEDGLANWLAMFGDSLFREVPAAEMDAVVAAVEERLRATCFDPATKTWTADYRRLRFVASAPS
jgi:trans-aconitate methyltransferase